MSRQPFCELGSWTVGICLFPPKFTESEAFIVFQLVNKCEPPALAGLSLWRWGLGEAPGGQGALAESLPRWPPGAGIDRQLFSRCGSPQKQLHLSRGPSINVTTC